MLNTDNKEIMVNIFKLLLKKIIALCWYYLEFCDSADLVCSDVKFINECSALALINFTLMIRTKHDKLDSLVATVEFIKYIPYKLNR